MFLHVQQLLYIICVFGAPQILQNEAILFSEILFDSLLFCIIQKYFDQQRALVRGEEAHPSRSAAIKR
jgi:hypothetical protein